MSSMTVDTSQGSANLPRHEVKSPKSPTSKDVMGSMSVADQESILKKAGFTPRVSPQSQGTDSLRGRLKVLMNRQSTIDQSNSLRSSPHTATNNTSVSTSVYDEIVEKAKLSKMAAKGKENTELDRYTEKVNHNNKMIVESSNKKEIQTLIDQKFDKLSPEKQEELQYASYGEKAEVLGGLLTLIKEQILNEKLYSMFKERESAHEYLEGFETLVLEAKAVVLGVILEEVTYAYKAEIDEAIDKLMNKQKNIKTNKVMNEMSSTEKDFQKDMRNLKNYYKFVLTGLESDRQKFLAELPVKGTDLKGNPTAPKATYDKLTRIVDGTKITEREKINREFRKNPENIELLRKIIQEISEGLEASKAFSDRMDKILSSSMTTKEKADQFGELLKGSKDDQMFKNYARKLGKQNVSNFQIQTELTDESRIGFKLSVEIDPVKLTQRFGKIPLMARDLSKAQTDNKKLENLQVEINGVGVKFINGAVTTYQDKKILDDLIKNPSIFRDEVVKFRSALSSLSDTEKLTADNRAIGSTIRVFCKLLKSTDPEVRKKIRSNHLYIELVEAEDLVKPYFVEKRNSSYQR